MKEKQKQNGNNDNRPLLEIRKIAVLPFKATYIDLTPLLRKGRSPNSLAYRGNGKS